MGSLQHQLSLFLSICCFLLQGLTNSHKSALKSLMLMSVLFTFSMLLPNVWRNYPFIACQSKLSLFFIRKWNDHKSFQPSVLGGPVYRFMISLLLRHLEFGRLLESWFPFIDQIYIENLPCINTFVTDLKNQMKTLSQICFHAIWQINNIWTQNMYQQHGFITKFWCRQF